MIDIFVNKILGGEQYVGPYNGALNKADILKWVESKG